MEEHFQTREVPCAFDCEAVSWEKDSIWNRYDLPEVVKKKTSVKEEKLLNHIHTDEYAMNA